MAESERASREMYFVRRCPECKGQVQDGAVAHFTGCANFGRMFAIETIEVRPVEYAPVSSGVDEEAAYGAAGRAAGEAVLEHGRDGARLRPANDAFLLSRIARACVDATLPSLRSPADEPSEEALSAALRELEDQLHCVVPVAAVRAALRAAAETREGGDGR